MSFITTEHRLRCDESSSCWITLSRQKKWSVVSVELPDGKVHNVLPLASFDTEEEALGHAKTWVCDFTGTIFR